MAKKKLSWFLRISTIGQIYEDRKPEPDFSIFRFEPKACDPFLYKQPYNGSIL